MGSSRRLWFHQWTHERGEFDVVDGAPRAVQVDEFVLVEAQDLLGHGVVGAVAA